MTAPGRSEGAGRTLLVRDLESRAREEILYELFLQAGPLTKVMICKDREGKPKSFGFVCFKHEESVPYAIALLDGIPLYGKPLKVQSLFGRSHSPEINSPTGGSEIYIDLHSPSYRSQEPSGNPPKDAPAHEYPGFQKMSEAAKPAQASLESALPHASDPEALQGEESTRKRKRKHQGCESDSSVAENKREEGEPEQKYKKRKGKKKGR